jgi:hypothetical protein
MLPLNRNRTDEEWEAFKHTIRCLYLQEDLSMRELMSEMSSLGFSATYGYPWVSHYVVVKG